VTNLRADPWDRYQAESQMYMRWWGEKLWTLMPAAGMVGQFLATFKEWHIASPRRLGHPPSQTSGTFSVEKALQMLQDGGRKN
jgi:hypothetical protein